MSPKPDTGIDIFEPVGMKQELYEASNNTACEARNNLQEEQDNVQNSRYIEIEANARSSRFIEAAGFVIINKTIPWYKRRPKRNSDPEIQELGKLVDALLVTYRDYFNDLVIRESWIEATCLLHFLKISEEVLDSDEENFNWTRIAMLLALASRMTCHCYKNGSSIEFVERFSKAVGYCIEQRVNTWTQRGDRWASLRSKASNSGGNSFIPLFGVGTTILSAVLTVINLSQSSSALTSFLKC